MSWRTVKREGPFFNRKELKEHKERNEQLHFNSLSRNCNCLNIESASNSKRNQPQGQNAQA